MAHPPGRATPTESLGRSVMLPQKISTAPSLGSAFPTPESKFLYDPNDVRDSCGTGFVASIDGTRTHRVVQLAVAAVGNLTHRGAVNADALTGDGAGVT